MQEGSRPRASAVVRVPPDHAACYWQSISETLERLGSADKRIEVSVLGPSARGPDAAASGLVELEIGSPDLEQLLLDEAVRQTPVNCSSSGDRAPAPVGWRETDDAQHRTMWAPLGYRADVTVSAPIADRLAPEVQTPGEPGPTDTDEPGSANGVANDSTPAHGAGNDSSRAASAAVQLAPTARSLRIRKLRADTAELVRLVATLLAVFHRYSIRHPDV